MQSASRAVCCRERRNVLNCVEFAVLSTPRHLAGIIQESVFDVSELRIVRGHNQSSLRVFRQKAQSHSRQSGFIEVALPAQGDTENVGGIEPCRVIAALFLKAGDKSLDLADQFS